MKLAGILAIVVVGLSCSDVDHDPSKFADASATEEVVPPTNSKPVDPVSQDGEGEVAVAAPEPTYGLFR